MSNREWQIYGHENAVQRLQVATQHSSSLRQANTLSHAYLITGARHSGKTLLAKTFAQTLLCAVADGESLWKPCGQCRSCRLLESDIHPDYYRFQPTDKEGNLDRSKGMLRVEQASEFIYLTALRPSESRYKVFLLQDVHCANDSFANKILKTLEEPSPHVVIILTATSRSELLSTIVSRCQLIDLRPVSVSIIEQMLTDDWHVETQMARLLARLADGRPGWAIRQLEKPQEWKEREDHLKSLQELITLPRIQRLSFAEMLTAKRNEQYLFGLLECWTTWWRDVLLTQSGAMRACCNIDYEAEIGELARTISVSAVQRYLHILKRVEGYLRHTTNTRLVLDTLLLQIPRPVEIH